MSTMFTPARPSATASSATTPGRFVTVTRSSWTGPPASRPRAGGGGPRGHGRSSRSNLGVACAQIDRVELAGGDRRVHLVGDRRARSACRCRSRCRSWRPPRGSCRGSSGRRAGAARPRGRAAVRAAWETSTFASTCGRWLTRREQAVVRVSASSATGRAPNETSSRAGARRGCRSSGCVRRQVPGRALEQVRAGVLDPGRLGARDRVAADEALVGRAPTRSRLVEPTSVTTVSGAAAARASSTSAGRAPTGAQAKTAARGAVDRLRRPRPRRAVDRAALEAPSQPLGVPVEADDLSASPARAPPGRSSRRSGRRRGPL